MHLEQRRQAAASGDQRFLAAVQPIPDISALSVPITIRQQSNWSVTSLIIIPLCVSLLALAISHFLPDRTFDALLFIASGILTVCLWSLQLWAIYSQRRTQITVTEDGLTLRGLHPNVRSISWKDARLFAIADLFGAKKYPYPILFEVSSAHEVIRWAWLRPSSRGILYFAKSVVPPEEYNKQMQDLLSLIAAHTGLSLYDLSGPQFIEH